MAVTALARTLRRVPARGPGLAQDAPQGRKAVKDTGKERLLTASGGALVSVLVSVGLVFWCGMVRGRAKQRPRPDPHGP